MASWNTDPDAFHVIIRSLLTGASAIDDPDAVTARVQKLYGEICALPTCSIKMGSVSIVKTAPANINAQDVVVHVVGSRNQSILTKYKRYPVETDANIAGRTYIGTSGNLSEVYWNAPYCDQPALLANMIVHEAMHNKLNMADGALHNQSGFTGDPGGFYQENLPRSPGLAWSKTDRDLLGPNLHKQNKQDVH